MVTAEPPFNFVDLRSSMFQAAPYGLVSSSTPGLVIGSTVLGCGRTQGIYEDISWVIGPVRLARTKKVRSHAPGHGRRLARTRNASLQEFYTRKRAKPENGPMRLKAFMPQSGPFHRYRQHPRATAYFGPRTFLGGRPEMTDFLIWAPSGTFLGDRRV